MPVTAQPRSYKRMRAATTLAGAVCGSSHTSPGVDVRAALAGSQPPAAAVLVEQRCDPAPGLGRIDHIVDLAVRGHVETLAALVGGRDRRLERLLALARILDRIELAAHAQAHSSLQAHRTELGGGPADREHRRLEAAAGHCLRTQAIA